MKQAAGYVFFFIIGFAFCFHYFVSKKNMVETREIASQPIAPASSNLSPSGKDYSPLFKKIYSELGLKNGDIIKAVNEKGSSDGASIFTDLVLGYQNKKLCVNYERDGAQKQACLNGDVDKVAELKDNLKNAKPKEIQKIYTETELNEEYRNDPDALARDHVIPELDTKTGKVIGYKKMEEATN